MALTVELVPHFDAGDRTTWSGDQDRRPLTDLGRRQAKALARAIDAVDALYSAPARRCHESLQPLAERLGLPIGTLRWLGERDAWTPPRGWSRGPLEALTGAFAAGAALSALHEVRAERTRGRVVACSHGHVIPALASFLIARHHLAPVPALARRGQWYRLRLDDSAVIELVDVPDFPG